MAAELKIDTIIKGAFSKGLKNALPLSINSILWALTVWIPYLNVGTTIGLSTIAAKMSKDEPLSMTEIFNPVYRKRMGEYFILLSLVSMGVSVGFAFLVIPGIVISIAWSLAALLLVDKQMNPLEAINQSNSFTYGHKGTIFFGSLILGLIVLVLLGVIGLIAYALMNATDNNTFVIVIMGLVVLIAYFIAYSIGIGATATIYKELAK